jgi:hypothetical protein
MEQVKKLANLDKIAPFLKEEKMRYLLQGILILYISFWLPDATYTSVASFNNVMVRLVFVLMIVILCLIDEFTSALLLTMAFILSIQRLNRYKIENRLRN